MTLAVVTRDEAASLTLQGLGLPGKSFSAEALYELLRATVWGLAPPPSNVHISRILAAALPPWRLLSGRVASDEALRGELRAALSVLEDVGDLIDVGGGYWTSSTTRFVRIPAGAGFLLVGGVPSGCLELGGAVEYHGPHRHVRDVPGTLAALPLEELASWARLPPREISLQQWKNELLETLARQQYAPASTEAFEFYIPSSVKVGTPQFKRWFVAAGNVTGLVLARRSRLYGAREHRLVEMRSGRIASVADLTGADVRRLMYALDQSAENPVRAKEWRTSNTLEWLFTSELPRAEQRVLAALGSLSIPEDRPFQRRWSVVRNHALALQLIRGLGIQVTPQREGV